MEEEEEEQEQEEEQEEEEEEEDFTFMNFGLHHVNYWACFSHTFV